MSLISFVKIQENAPNSLKQAIIKSLGLIDYSMPRETKSVVIKPNMCYYWDYTTGQTTDPSFVAALIELLRDRISTDAAISIVEADASAMRCEHAFKMLNYERISSEYGATLVNLSKDECEPVEVNVAGHSLRLMVPEVIQRADLKINVPKIKYSREEIKITCALKNIFGCNPYPKKSRFHPWIAELIVGLNKAMRFDLCLVDANIVSGVEPRRLGLVMASRDPVAVDSAAAQIASIDPYSIEYLRLACQEGLGNMRFSSRGESLNEFRNRYPSKNGRQRLIDRAYHLVMRMRERAAWAEYSK